MVPLERALKTESETGVKSFTPFCWGSYLRKTNSDVINWIGQLPVVGATFALSGDSDHTFESFSLPPHLKSTFLFTYSNMQLWPSQMVSALFHFSALFGNNAIRVVPCHFVGLRAQILQSQAYGLEMSESLGYGFICLLIKRISKEYFQTKIEVGN